MSEHENISGEATDHVSPVVVVESASSKHTLPYRPTEFQDVGAPDLHQKRAPAVASVTENWKDTPADTNTKDLKESEYAISSERHKHVAKKLSSGITSKRRGSPLPAAIPMTTMDSENKSSEMISGAQPIPPLMGKKSPIPGIDKNKELLEEKGDDDSITSEITEMRTPEVAKKPSEWENEKEDKLEEAVPLQRKLGNEEIKVSPIDEEPTLVETCTSSEAYKKKEISWSDEAYLKKVPLQDSGVRSTTWMLEGKASVGPCFTRGMPFSHPSGITICLPEKSSKNVNPVKSGISIMVSKKCSDNTLKFIGPLEYATRKPKGEPSLKIESEMGLKIKEDSQSTYCANLREKLDNLCGRIKHVLRI